MVIMIDVKGFKKDDAENNNGFVKKIVLFGCIAVVLVLLYYFGKGYFEYIKVKEVGDQYVSVFFKNLFTAVTVRGISFLVALVSVLVSILFLRRNLSKLNIERGLFDSLGTSLVLSIVAAVFLSGFLDNGISDKFLVFSKPQWFGTTDPVFGRDIGYYVFQRPFVAAVVDAAFSLSLFVTGFTLLAYWFFGAVFSDYSGKQMLSVKAVANHNYVNIGIILAINCVSYVLKAEGILYDHFGELSGAGFTAKTVWLTYYRVAPILLIGIIIAAGIFLAKGKTAATIKTLLVFPAFWLAAVLVALGVQGIVVSPNEVIREQENIAANIEYTQAAYGIDGISEVEFEVKNDLTAAQLSQHREITDNIRILDLSANLTVLNQIQGIRNYYRFNETDIVPYNIDGIKTAVAITPREITKENLSDSADTYINRTLRYTHGFGVTMNVLNEVTAQGQPQFLIKDIPPRSEEGIQEIKQPRIYYGELTNDYVVVGNKKYKELDYSAGQEDIEFSYDGEGGLPLSFLNRALFAVKYGDIRLLISDLFSADSRILINRNVVERLVSVAPFLDYDSDPYMIIDDDGSLKWVVDAYTKTSYYPYSQSYGDFNYIRNSVKAVVDAYNGDVTLYIVDKKDPIVRNYSEIYPQLFADTELPEGIREHVKYPEYMFRVQSEVYGKYHISNPTTFYNKNDMWSIAKERYGNATEPKELAPYYNMMKLEGKDEEELLLTIPFTLSNKDNMVAWFAVCNEWDSYGRLQVYKFPKDINVYGPMQIENRINSDMNISKELNLWSQGGSKVIRGNMIVVPIDNSILYVEPIYIASSNQSTLPELKQVVVAYDEKIVMESSLESALYALFDEKAPQKPETPQTGGAEGAESTENETEVTYESAARRIIEEFRRAKQANAEGNWSGFGESMEALEKSIGELEKSLNETVE
ncbi:MAG: UPF0182 family protein [Ruminococcaceae bacterium]|nr:UPF0182 family protein [Oscillospiraceae bacterium]